MWVYATDAFQQYVRGLASDGSRRHQDFKGVVDLAKMWDEGFKKHTPREFAYGHSKRAGARSSKATKHLDGMGLTAGSNTYDPHWDQAAGYDEAQASHVAQHACPTPRTYVVEYARPTPRTYLVALAIARRTRYRTITLPPLEALTIPRPLTTGHWV